MSKPQTSSAYDKVSYPAYVYPQTHPDRLATIGTLLGMTPAPVENCRVLELACGDGGNVLPMASELPRSKFLGIDLASQPIAKGQQMIQALGLKNIELSNVDLMYLSREFGEFDYIIAHGLFSWVEEPVREKILSICRTSLSPQGIAYISYNAYPGCHIREIAREMMLFHSKNIGDPTEKVNQCRAVIKWIADGQTQSNSYTQLLSEINARFEKRLNGSIYHDELSEVNNSFYFHQFISQANQHDLQFLAEADYFESSTDSSFTAEVAAQLEQLGRQDILAREQYLDFLKGRAFRQTLLCHCEVELQRPIGLQQIKPLLVRSQVKPLSSAPDIKSREVEEFGSTNDAQASTDLPLAKAAFTHLAEIYPRATSFEELIRQARNMVGTLETTVSEDTQTLADVIIKSFEVGVVELITLEPACKVRPGVFPKVSPLARLQAQQDNVVTTLFHRSLKLEDKIVLQLMLLLDGTRDRTELIRELGQIIQSSAQLSAAEKHSMLQAVPQQLDEKLNEMGRLGLLLA